MVFMSLSTNPQKSHAEHKADQLYNSHCFTAGFRTTPERRLVFLSTAFQLTFLVGLVVVGFLYILSGPLLCFEKMRGNWSISTGTCSIKNGKSSRACPEVQTKRNKRMRSETGLYILELPIITQNLPQSL